MERYKEYAELDKGELISKVIYLEDKEEELGEELRELEDELSDYEYEFKGLEKYQDGEWVNVDNFIYRLKLENLYDDKMEKFIEDYIKWYNN